MATYGPYTDTTLYPTFDISGVPNVECFCLGFIVANDGKNPSWGGYYDIWTDFYKDIIAKVRANGGKLICSFGGASGTELALVCNEDELYDRYKWTIDMYKFDSVDFDIEGGALFDTKANQRRANAIVKLKETFPKLKVSLTLPVNRTGLDKDALDLVKQTPCDLVNIMAMDYGNVGDMGQAACDAAYATRKQTGKNIGVTVMIGKNDTVEVFSLSDAKVLKKYQEENAWIKRLSIWAIERDRGKPGDLSRSSQVEQSPYEFSSILQLNKCC